jgi:hypothetical protein
MAGAVIKRQKRRRRRFSLARIPGIGIVYLGTHILPCPRPNAEVQLQLGAVEKSPLDFKELFSPFFHSHTAAKKHPICILLTKRHNVTTLFLSVVLIIWIIRGGGSYITPVNYITLCPYLELAKYLSE